MHESSMSFLEFIAKYTPYHFTKGKRVLDVGSGDVNGTNGYLFDASCRYDGNDVVPGKNVSLMYKTSELPFFEPTFDTIISSGCFEHDPEYSSSLQKIVSLLRPSGLFTFTCASTGHLEYGTRSHEPKWSLASRVGLSKWRHYYRNISFDDISKSINLNKEFSQYSCYYNSTTFELYFIGIKRNNTQSNLNFIIPEYIKDGCVNIANFATPELRSRENASIGLENTKSIKFEKHENVSKSKINEFQYSQENRIEYQDDNYTQGLETKKILSYDYSNINSSELNCSDVSKITTIKSSENIPNIIPIESTDLFPQNNLHSYSINHRYKYRLIYRNRRYYYQLVSK